MAEIINLNRARKAKAKVETEARAKANRAYHGLTKAEKKAAIAETAREKARLDAKKLDE